MAKLAASGYDHQDSADGESYIEKYIKSVAAVESIITLDRLGQVSEGYNQLSHFLNNEIKFTGSLLEEEHLK